MNKEKTKPAKVRKLAKSQRTSNTRPAPTSSIVTKTMKAKAVAAGKSETSNLSAAKAAGILKPEVYLGSD
jgi:hypothetical protein